jgi:hypothetical protein
MASGDEPRQTEDEPSGVYALGALAVAGGVGVAVGALLLMFIGIVVRDLSVLVGTPLPYVRDDPNRVEWGGVAELVAYGVAGAVVLYALYLVGRRVLPATARGHIGRVIGAAVLLALAMGAGLVTVEQWDLRAAGFALACVYGAYRVARGLPDDDDSHTV